MLCIVDLSTTFMNFGSIPNFDEKLENFPKLSFLKCFFQFWKQFQKTNCFSSLKFSKFVFKNDSFRRLLPLTLIPMKKSSR